MRRFWLLLIRDARSNNLIRKIIINILSLIIIHIIFSFSLPLDLLSKTAASIFTISLVILLLMSLDQIAASDLADGTIDLLLSMRVKYRKIILYKAINHIISILIPIIIIELITGFMFYKMNFYDIGYSLLLKFMVIPTISLVSVITSFATNNMRNISMLLIFYFPMIIAPILLINIAFYDNNMINAVIAYGAFGAITMAFLGGTK